MNCEVCGERTNINWGDGVTVICKKCINSDNAKSVRKRNAIKANNKKQEVGFLWWKLWAWLHLTIGNFYTFYLLHDFIVLAFMLIIPTTILMLMILKYNKYAFLLATILTPHLWIINGIYLKNRWNNEKVNA